MTTMQTKAVKIVRPIPQAVLDLVIPPPPPPPPPPRISRQAAFALAEQIRREQEESALRKLVKIDRVIKVVCDTLDIDPMELGTKCRHERVVLARELVTVLARDITIHSFPEIARFIGRPNHSTVITAFQRYEKTKDVLFEYGGANVPKSAWLLMCKEAAVKS